MAKNHLKHLGAALGFEDDDSVAAAEGEGLNGSETVEGEMLEVADADAEATEVNTDVEQTEETIENLEDIAVAMESAAANGGLSREAAVFANLALKAAVGPKAARVIMPAMPSFESYSGGSASRRATTLSVEIVGETLRKFWQALVAKIKQLWNKLRGWWKKMTDAAPKIKARAEALAKKSADISGTAEERTIELSLALQLHISGRTPQPSAIIKIVQDLDKASDKLIGTETKGEMEKEARAFEDLMQGLEDNTSKTIPKGTTLAGYYRSVASNKTQAANNAQIDKAKGGQAAVNAVGTSSPSDLATRFGSDANHYLSSELPGGKAIVASVSTLKNTDESFTMTRFVRGCSIRFTDFLAKPKDVESNGEFKTMSSSEIRSVCDAIADLMDKIIAYDKNWQAREKLMNDTEKSASKVISAAERDTGTDGDDNENLGLRSKIIKDLANAMLMAQRLDATFESAYINYCTKISQAILQWAERSMAQYK